MMLSKWDGDLQNSALRDTFIIAMGVLCVKDSLSQHIGLPLRYLGKGDIRDVKDRQ
jgi:hypothetical protein